MEAGQRCLSDTSAHLPAAVADVQDPGGDRGRHTQFHNSAHVDAQGCPSTALVRQGEARGATDTHAVEVDRELRRVALPPTICPTAGEPAAAAAPSPTSSSTAPSPMSGAASHHRFVPGSRTPNSVPLRAIVVTTDEPSTFPAHALTAWAAAIARVRNSR